MKNNNQKFESINKLSEKIFEEGKKVARKIWEFAEPSLKEFQSAEILSNFLGNHGFEITYPFDNIPTAFKATWGNGGPVIGFLGEYDALPDCGLEANEFGHGCGHNLLGTGSAMAAIIAAKLIKNNNIKGTIVYWGCPAEETLAGKVYMARDGAFRDLDACLGWHPSSKNQVDNAGGTAMDSLVFDFTGKTAHGAYAHTGRSALDAAMLMDVAVNYLREHIPENVRIHSVVKDGGDFPNVVPEKARIWYYVRGEDRAQVDEITSRVKKCAKGAAISTETNYESKRVTGVYSLLSNDALAENLLYNFQKLGVHQFDENNKEIYQKYDLKIDFANELDKDIVDEASRGSSDEANVSWLSPYGRINVACIPQGVSGHHREETFCVNKSFAYKGMRKAGEVMAASAYDLIADSQLLQQVKKEFAGKTEDFSYDPLVEKNQNVEKLLDLFNFSD